MAKKEIIISDNRDFKGVWIPERIYLSREFSPNEKFVLIEIHSLTRNKTRECFASNRHLADFVGLKENSIQKMLLKFEKAGYIKRIYEYRENSREIDRRVIKLTNKFYEAFINERECEDGISDNMEKNPYGHGEKSTCPMDKNPEGGGKNVGDKYNSIKYNNNKYNNISDTEKVNTSSEKKKKVKTLSGEKENIRDDKKSYSELKELERDMVARAEGICANHFKCDPEITEEVSRTILYYLKKYTEKTGKIHPILRDETLSNVIENLISSVEDEYARGGFRPIEINGTYIDMIDEHFKVDYGKINGRKNDWHLPYFATEGVILNLCYRIGAL